ncbi:unnamed protein product [Urochloa humidicola]
MDVHGASSLLAQPPRPMVSINTSRGVGAASSEDDEPLSPIAHMPSDLYIVTVVGLATPVDAEQARAGLEVTLARHPRFCSIQVMDGGDSARWAQTTVNLDNHIIIPDFDPDKVLEDYVFSLSTLPMDKSRPLWELHLLNFPTTEAVSAAVFRLSHGLGDGTSLNSLLLACTRAERCRSQGTAGDPSKALNLRRHHAAAGVAPCRGRHGSCPASCSLGMRLWMQCASSPWRWSS